jgi:hypothetical protein
MKERGGRMNGAWQRWLLSVVVGLLVFTGLSSPATADDAPSSISTKTIDQNLHLALRDVINQGADLFNQSDHRGCYYLFVGALKAARSQLGHHPDVQKIIDDSLARTEQYPSMGRRAWTLRKTLDQVRDKINPNPGKSSEKKTEETQPSKPSEQKPADKKPEDKKSEDKKNSVDKKPTDKKPGEPKPPDK